MSTLLVEMRDISVSFGGVKAVEMSDAARM